MAHCLTGMLAHYPIGLLSIFSAAPMTHIHIGPLGRCPICPLSIVHLAHLQFSIFLLDQ
jgi:hypothetical protein